MDWNYLIHVRKHYASWEGKGKHYGVFIAFERVVHRPQVMAVQDTGL